VYSIQLSQHVRVDWGCITFSLVSILKWTIGVQHSAEQACEGGPGVYNIQLSQHVRWTAGVQHWAE
jgi:hypothetical protein